MARGLVVLVSVIVWGWIWGVAGMLLSVPLTMAAKIALESREETRWVAHLLQGSGNTATPDGDAAAGGASGGAA